MGSKPSKAQYYVNDVLTVSDILDNIKNIVERSGGVRCRSIGRASCARPTSRWMSRASGRAMLAGTREEIQKELFIFKLS